MSDDDKKPRRLTEEEYQWIRDAVATGRVCMCHTVGRDGEALNLECPMHPKVAFPRAIPDGGTEA